MRLALQSIAEALRSTLSTAPVDKNVSIELRRLATLGLA
jgi:hypothetical protein